MAAFGWKTTCRSTVAVRGFGPFKSDDVEIVNNTAYKNGQVVGYADIMVNQSASVKVVNKIAYSRQGAARSRLFGA